MTGLVRKHFSIRPAQDLLLKQRAQVLGVTQSGLIRRAIDLVVRALAQDSFDERSWADELAFMRQRRHPTRGSPAHWQFCRKDLYQ